MFAFVQFFTKNVILLPHKHASLCTMRLHITDTSIHTRHQYVGRTACLQHSKILVQPVTIDSCSLHMQKRRLRHGRQCFVQAVNHQIRPTRNGTRRLLAVKPQMRPMSCIHDQNLILPVYHVCNRTYIGKDALVSRRSDHHRLAVCMLSQKICNLFRIHTTAYAVLFYHSRMIVLQFQFL